MEKKEEIATKFMLQGICEFGQTEEERANATANFLKEKGFDVEPSGFPVFGGMFPQQKILGKDGDEAYEWLKGILGSLQRGKFEHEVKQLTEALS